MGVGRSWSMGHGHEFRILSEALEKATEEQISDFRKALEASVPIMEARKIIHTGVPMTRTSRFGVPLGDWDPMVTQFRWYDERARFWDIGSESAPYQVERIMREALLTACRFHEDGHRRFEFWGRCECPKFKIECGVRRCGTSGEEIVTFCVYVPDHWGSEDLTGRDGEGRPAAMFGIPGPAAADGDARAKDLDDGELGQLFPSPAGGPEPDRPFAGRARARKKIVWDAEATGRPVPRSGPPADPPPSERRRLKVLERLTAHQPRPPAAPNDAPAPPPDAVSPPPHGVSSREPASSGDAAAGSADAGPTGDARKDEPPAKESVVARSHGVAAASTGLDLPAVDSPGGLYGRLFPSTFPSAPSEALFEEYAALAKKMIKADAITKLGEPDEEENRYIAAMYTYFGQFVDHDVTFDPSPILERTIDPHLLVDFRTPRLDLDSLYGRGPRDQPYLYDGDHFVLGKPIPLDGQYRPDLPRTPLGRALIGDPRNDDHIIISQLTALFLRFHNAVVDGLDRGGRPRSFAEAQQLVRWHYQWLVVHDFLPTIIGEVKAAQYLGAIQGPTGDVASQLRIRLDREGGLPFMPVEFSAAAFRFGHSMVRPAYAINRVMAKDNDRTPILPFPNGHPSGENLHGRRAVPDGMAIDWAYFLPEPNTTGIAGLPQGSYLIDTNLVEPLANLGSDILGGAGGPTSLAERTLRRSVQLRLPSGQAVARHLRHDLEYRDCHVLGRDELDLAAYPFSAESTPLWYYILREAEVTRGGYQLGAVGGTLVAEVLLGLLVADPTSFVHQEGWRPFRGAEPGRFTLADLVRLGEMWEGKQGVPTG